MSPVRRHFWQLVALVNSSLHFPRKWSLKGFMPAGVNSTLGSQVGTSTSLAWREQPLETKNSRYFSRSSSVFMPYLECQRDSQRLFAQKAIDEPAASGESSNSRENQPAAGRTSRTVMSDQNPHES